MDNTSALDEEALAIVSIYGPSSFYPITGSATSTSTDSTPVYTLKVSLEEPNFDFDPSSQDEPQNSSGTNRNLGKSRRELEFRIYFPEGYPETNSSAPVHEIVSIYYGTLRLTNAIIQEIDQGLDECFVPGEVVVFTWIEWLRNFLEELEARMEKDSLQGHSRIGHDNTSVNQSSDREESKDEDEDSSESHRAASDYFSTDDSPQDLHGSVPLLSSLSSSLSSLSLLHSPASSSDNNSLRVPRVGGVPEFSIRSGPPIVDRKSVFVAHLASITQPSQAPLMIQQLKQENKKVVKATHNIMAFRVENDNGTISQDNDDDGETAAGSRLLHLMSILDVKNVVVVVSRWYGGIPLSADRFKHINNAARLLLDDCGYIKPATSAEAIPNVNSKKKSHSKKSGKR
ncbi:hypothetical protein BGX27_010061 [Mortierella sp. AM989]|nr:hypothetical protein BGX27_010061 [Mortierella sp. AM989]